MSSQQTVGADLGPLAGIDLPTPPHAQNDAETAAGTFPSSVLGFRDKKHYAIRRYHGISPGFTIHYQYLGYRARISEQQDVVLF